MRRFFSVLFFLLALAGWVIGQTPQTEFGKNRVQFKNFKWRLFSTENFDVYFYDGGEKNARLAVDFLEEEFENVTELIGYAPYSKTKIFLYNSIAELQQSNVNIDADHFEESGQTNFIKLRIEVAFPGTYTAFREELVLKITDMLVKDMMFGGSLAELLQSTYLFNLPEWFTSGISRYVAKGWSLDMDDYMRDLFVNQNLKRLARFEGKDAEMVGHSIWNYIATKYGRSNISNILNLTRITRDEEAGIANTLGIPFKQFLLEWQDYYSEMEEEIREGYVEPKKENRLRKRNRRDWIYKHIKISPNGQYIAYSENYKGRYRVKIRDTETGNEDVVLRGGYKVINQEIDPDIPLISWRDNNTIGIINIKFGRNYLWLYEISSKSKLKKDLSRFNHIKDFDFSPSGNLVVFSGDVYGQNDLFIMSLRRNAIKRLTDDPYDDIAPRFVPNTTALVFSSNRPTDSLKTTNLKIGEASEYFNLFMFDLDTSRTLVKRLTNNLSRDINPLPIDENQIYYLSDQKGVLNIYKFVLDKQVFHQVTNFNTSLNDFDINYNTGMIAFTTLNEGKEYVFFEKGFRFDKTVFSPPTIRQQVIQAKFVSERLRRKELEEEEDSTNLMDFLISEEVGPVDLPEEPVLNEDTVIIRNEPVIDSASIDTEIIDTDNYVFDSELIKDAPETSVIENYRKSLKEIKIVGPIPYTPRFSADNIVTSFIIDPLFGFGIKLNTQMNDIFENHKINGGFVTTTNLESGTIFGEYEYLKYQVDYGIKFDREVLVLEDLEEDGSSVTQKYARNTVKLKASLPFSVTSRVSLEPFYTLTNYYDINPAGINRSQGPPADSLTNRRHYAGLRFNFTYDNTISNGLNLREGWRASLSVTRHQRVAGDGDNLTFNNFHFDVRNYQKIHREIVFATRVYYGRFFGDTRPNYFVGGVDNWIGNKTEHNFSNDPLTFQTGVDKTNILFSEFITSLRGFNYNEFNGSNSMLFNAELRLPIVRYLHRGPISSNFFRNLLFVGFFDAGTAWNGGRVIPRTNDINTRVIPDDGQGPFVIRVRNLANPWLYSYGLGMRTILLGYYMKLDVAWPVENYETKSTRFQVSLGYDF